MNSDQKLARKFGMERAKKIRARLDDLAAADCLEVMKDITGNCHELSADRKGQLAVSLTGNYRLVFVPDHDPPVLKEDGGLDWLNITKIKVTEVVDYH